MTDEPHDFVVHIQRPTSLPEILDSFDLRSADRFALLAALHEREDALAEAMQLVAQSFGMYPQIVAFWMVRVGLGTPRPPEVVGEINRQYAALMEEAPWEHPDDPSGT